MENKKYELTKEKLESLKLELADLQTRGRQEIADTLELIRQTFSDEEGFEVSDELDKKFILERNIIELQEIIDNACVVDEGLDCKESSIGNYVTVSFDGFEETYQLVSSLEADPISKKISIDSPVGRALLKSKIGDIVKVDTGMLKKKFRILDIK